MQGLDSMLGQIVRQIVTVPTPMLGTLIDLLRRLCGEEGQRWFTALKRFLRGEDPWDGEKAFLRLLSTINFPSVDRFVVREAFDGGGTLPITSMSQRFQEWLSRVEECDPGILSIYKITELVGDFSLGDGHAGFYHLYQVLMTRKDKENSGVVIICRIRRRNILSAVSASWMEGGWVLEADEPGEMGVWPLGAQLISFSPTSFDS